ncbi:hypothetical protein KC19_7G105800 [Ceratodon purpureus]|uniref:Uncharacterized protein n=1 Tax=Ceratodon purpureus TaxID=3225 RepID=A0A8T0H4V4_CERPU|nr:hypothetical protein KC19_7G105800 [Ceratodon purpureus]
MSVMLIPINRSERPATSRRTWPFWQSHALRTSAIRQCGVEGYYWCNRPTLYPQRTELKSSYGHRQLHNVART